MGQQSNKVQKRRRRLDYQKRKKLASKATAATAKPVAAKTAAASAKKPAPAAKPAAAPAAKAAPIAKPEPSSDQPVIVDSSAKS